MGWDGMDGWVLGLWMKSRMDGYTDELLLDGYMNESVYEVKDG